MAYAEGEQLETVYFDIMGRALNSRVEKCTGYKEWVAVCDAPMGGNSFFTQRRYSRREKGFSSSTIPSLFFRLASMLRQLRSGIRGRLRANERVGSRRGGVSETRVRPGPNAGRMEPGESPGAFHIWTEDLVRERFDCGDVQQIHCALVRVYRISEPFILPYAKGYGGCRTWVNLPVAPPEHMEPVMEDHAFGEKRRAIESILS